jgi:Winged helix DNA-binding domain
VDEAALIGYRLRTNGLLSRGRLADALPAGVQDSAPRAAQLSLHARVAGLPVDGWADPSLCQVWGPRWAAYLIKASDLAVFTVGRLPRDDQTIVAKAARVAATLGDREISPAALTRELGLGEHDLRGLSPSGRFLLRWDASQITIHATDPPTTEPAQAQRELARRYLRVLGPSDHRAFAKWATIPPRDAAATFDELAGELVTIEGRQLLARDEALWSPTAATGVRLLPGEDAFLRHDRDILVPDPEQRATLFPRHPAGVLRGAILVEGQVRGWWQRQGTKVGLHPFGKAEPWQPEAESEAWTLPVPGGITDVIWPQ